MVYNLKEKSLHIYKKTWQDLLFIIILFFLFFLATALSIDINTESSNSVYGGAELEAISVLSLSD